MAKKKKKSYAKKVMGLGAGVIGAAVGAHALGAVGGTSATHGQKALAGVTKLAPAAGKIIGVSVPVKIMHNAFPKKKIKKILR